VSSPGIAGDMPLFVENLTAHGHLHVEDETRRLLLQMSPATIGRLLATERRTYRLHEISHTRSTPLGGRIPIQTCMDPPLDIPGILAVDLVGHDRERAAGDFGWTLTVSPGWTEAGAVRTKSGVVMIAALESCLWATRAALDMTSLLHEILLPRGCCCIRGVYWPGPTG